MVQHVMPEANDSIGATAMSLQDRLHEAQADYREARDKATDPRLNRHTRRLWRKKQRNAGAILRRLETALQKQATNTERGAEQ